MLSRFVRAMMAMGLILGLAIPASAASTRNTGGKGPDAETKQKIADMLSSATKQRLEQYNLPTTATLDRRFNRITGIPDKIPTTEEAAALSTDSLVALFRTGRPALGVGWFESYDSATSTVLIRMDPKLTAFPRTIKVKAERLKIPVDRLYQRENKGERRFKIDARTYILDDSSPLDMKPGQKERLTPKLQITSFKMGDKVSVSYRIVPDSNVIPKALNISKVDPNRTYYSADFDPLRGRIAVKRQARPTTGTTTVTTGTTTMRPGLPLRRGTQK